MFLNWSHFVHIVDQINGDAADCCGIVLSNYFCYQNCRVSNSAVNVTTGKINSKVKTDEGP